MKTFLEVEGKMGPFPVPPPHNHFRPPLPETNPNVRKSDVQKREREPHLRSSDQQPQNLPQCTIPYQWLHQSLRITCPYLQYQQEKTSHGLAQARCQGTSSRTEIGYSLKTIWPLKTKMRMQLV